MKSHPEDNKNSPKKRKSRSLLIGSMIAIIIAITPFIFYSYEYFPHGPTLETWLFTYVSKYQESVSLAMWIYLGKIVPLLLLILWFFTCKHWWYHTILIPAAMYSFQLFSSIVEDTGYIDEVEIYWLLPIMMIIIPFVYFIRVKLFDKHVLGIDLEAMEKELNTLKQKANYKPTTDEELEKLKNNTLWEYLNRKLSTHRLEAWFQQFLQGLKF